MKIVRAETAGQMNRLQKFVAEWEYMCVGLSARLSAGGRDRFFYAEENNVLYGAFCITGSRLLFHLVPDADKLTAGDMIPVATQVKPYCVSGSKEGAALLQPAIQRVWNIEPACRWNYLLMTARLLRRPPLPEPFAFRRGTPADLNILYPLRAAYEQAEVLPDGQRHNPDICRTSLLSILEKSANITVWNGREPAAMACFNASGSHWNQIGGVYTVPAYRNRGIGAFMAGELAYQSSAAGKKTVLFAKNANHSALSAYQKAGFAATGSYHLSYYF